MEKIKNLIFILVLFFCTNIYSQIDYTTEQLNTILINVDSKATLLLASQTIDASVAVGKVCELTTSGWNEADATAEGTADGLLGICTYVNTGVGTIIIQGIYTTTGLSAGTLYWLSETEGQWTSTKPTTVGTIVKFVGQAISTTQLLLWNNLWLEN